MFKKSFFILVFLCLVGCGGFKETNNLALPNIFKEEYELFLKEEKEKKQKKEKKSKEEKNQEKEEKKEREKEENKEEKKKD